MLISIWTRERKKNIYFLRAIPFKISTRNWNARFIWTIERLYTWKIFHLESFHHPDSATRKNVCFSVEISREEERGWGRNGGNNVAESVSLVLWSTECNGTSIQLQRREKSLVLRALVSSSLSSSSSPPRPPPPVPHSFVSSSYPWSRTLLSVKPNPHHWITVYRTVYDVIELSVTSRQCFSTLFWGTIAPR